MSALPGLPGIDLKRTAGFFLQIRGAELELAVQDDHDDQSDPGKCRMVVSLNSMTKLQALLREAGGSLTCRLIERLDGGGDRLVTGHEALRIVTVSSTTAASFLDATLVGGGEVVAELEQPSPPPPPRGLQRR